MSNETVLSRPRRGKKERRSKHPFRVALSQWRLYVLLIPALLAVIIFHYIPMAGLSAAFKDLYLGQTFWEGTWVGWANFQRLFTGDYFWNILKNTLSITFVQHFILWPLPILFALLVHNSSSRGIRKFAQTASYLPHLVSMVVIVSIINLFCHYETGIINIVFRNLGLEQIDFLGEEKYFLPMYFISDIWATLGSSAVVYIAALSSVDTQLIEAATIDGASKMKRIWHVDLPAIRPTIILLLIMGMGRMLSLGYEKVYLMQNDLNLMTSEIIGTFVYKAGVLGGDYGYTTAASLFNNVIGLILVLVSNRIAKKFADISLI